MTNLSDQTAADQEGFEAADKSAWVRRELSKVGQRYLVAMAMVFSAFYGIRGVGYFVSPGGAEGLRLGGVAVLTALIGIGIFVRARKSELPPPVVESCFLAICGLLLFNTSWSYIQGFNNELTPNFSFVAIAAGLGTISIRIWLLQLAVIIGAYAGILATIGPPDGRPFLFYLLTGVALSFLAFKARISVVEERVALDAELMDKAAKLEAANKAKDRFLANMTHDLRTPMTGVLGMMDLLRDTRLSKEQARLLETAKTSAGYLLAIINDILDYSKLESGKFELKQVPTDAVAVTRDIVEMLRSQAQVKGIGLEVTLPDAPAVWVNADGVRVGQILFNLVGNAIKFTEKGGVDVILECQETAATVSLVWRIRDTGAGIPKARIPKLFERFEQLDSSSTRQQGGTGLGLAIIKELLDLMGGEVDVESTVGEGTEFRFAIPFECCEPARPVTPEGVVEAAPAPALDRALRVLVAEDNRINRALIEKLLAKQGWHVDMVEDGEAAVAAVTKTEARYDLVLMDVQMPVMDGLTATKVLLDKMVAPPPIVALTANTMADDVKKYLAAGMKGHVGKPIDMDELRTTISRVMQEETASRQKS